MQLCVDSSRCMEFTFDTNIWREHISRIIHQTSPHIDTTCTIQYKPVVITMRDIVHWHRLRYSDVFEKRTGRTVCNMCDCAYVRILYMNITSLRQTQQRGIKHIVWSDCRNNIIIRIKWPALGEIRWQLYMLGIMLSDSKIYYHTYVIIMLRLALCGESGMFMRIHVVVFVVNGDCFCWSAGRVNVLERDCECVCVSWLYYNSVNAIIILLSVWRCNLLTNNCQNICATFARLILLYID